MRLERTVDKISQGTETGKNEILFKSVSLEKCIRSCLSFFDLLSLLLFFFFVFWISNNKTRIFLLKPIKYQIGTSQTRKECEECQTKAHNTTVGFSFSSFSILFKKFEWCLLSGLADIVAPASRLNLLHQTIVGAANQNTSGRLVCVCVCVCVHRTVCFPPLLFVCVSVCVCESVCSVCVCAYTSCRYMYTNTQCLVA